MTDIEIRPIRAMRRGEMITAAYNIYAGGRHVAITGVEPNSQIHLLRPVSESQEASIKAECDELQLAQHPGALINETRKVTPPPLPDEEEEIDDQG